MGLGSSFDASGDDPDGSGASEFPKRRKQNDTAPIHGKMIYLRRTDGEGQIRFLEKEFLVSEHGINWLVRAEVDFDQGSITFYRLRRQEPNKQDVLKKNSNK